MTFMDGEGEGG